MFKNDRIHLSSAGRARKKLSLKRKNVAEVSFEADQDVTGSTLQVLDPTTMVKSNVEKYGYPKSCGESDQEDTQCSSPLLLATQCENNSDQPSPEYESSCKHSPSPYILQNVVNEGSYGDYHTQHLQNSNRSLSVLEEVETLNFKMISDSSDDEEMEVYEPHDDGLGKVDTAWWSCNIRKSSLNTTLTTNRRLARVTCMVSDDHRNGVGTSDPTAFETEVHNNARRILYELAKLDQFSVSSQMKSNMKVLKMNLTSYNASCAREEALRLKQEHTHQQYEDSLVTSKSTQTPNDKVSNCPDVEKHDTQRYTIDEMGAKPQSTTLVTLRSTKPYSRKSPPLTQLSQQTPMPQPALNRSSRLWDFCNDAASNKQTPLRNRRMHANSSKSQTCVEVSSFRESFNLPNSSKTYQSPNTNPKHKFQHNNTSIGKRIVVPETCRVKTDMLFERAPTTQEFDDELNFTSISSNENTQMTQYVDLHKVEEDCDLPYEDLSTQALMSMVKKRKGLQMSAEAIDIPGIKSSGMTDCRDSLEYNIAQGASPSLPMKRQKLTEEGVNVNHNLHSKTGEYAPVDTEYDDQILDSSSLPTCPLCNQSFAMNLIEAHASSCDGFPHNANVLHRSTSQDTPANDELVNRNTSKSTKGDKMGTGETMRSKKLTRMFGRFDDGVTSRNRISRHHPQQTLLSSFTPKVNLSSTSTPRSSDVRTIASRIQRTFNKTPVFTIPEGDLHTNSKHVKDIHEHVSGTAINNSSNIDGGVMNYARRFQASKPSARTHLSSVSVDTIDVRTLDRRSRKPKEITILSDDSLDNEGFNRGNVSMSAEIDFADDSMNIPATNINATPTRYPDVEDILDVNEGACRNSGMGASSSNNAASYDPDNFVIDEAEFLNSSPIQGFVPLNEPHSQFLANQFGNSRVSGKSRSKTSTNSQSESQSRTRKKPYGRGRNRGRGGSKYKGPGRVAKKKKTSYWSTTFNNTFSLAFQSHDASRSKDNMEFSSPEIVKYYPHVSRRNTSEETNKADHQSRSFTTRFSNWLKDGEPLQENCISSSESSEECNASSQESVWLPEQGDTASDESTKPNMPVSESKSAGVSRSSSERKYTKWMRGGSTPNKNEALDINQNKRENILTSYFYPDDISGCSDTIRILALRLEEQSKRVSLQTEVCLCGPVDFYHAIGDKVGVRIGSSIGSHKERKDSVHAPPANPGATNELKQPQAGVDGVFISQPLIPPTTIYNWESTKQHSYKTRTETKRIKRGHASSGYSNWFQCPLSTTNSLSDQSWSCGYRNTQILLSHIIQAHIPGNENLFHGSGTVKSVMGIQRGIEESWEAGFDKHGARQLGHSLVGTSIWVGPTEVVSMLRCAGISARIVAFRSSATVDRNRIPDLLFDFVWDYFKVGDTLHTVSESNLEERTTRQFSHIKWPASIERESSAFKSACKNAFDRLSTGVPPLFLQHNGHSRTVVGCSKSTFSSGENSKKLILFDPSERDLNEKLLDGNSEVLSNTVQWPMDQSCFYNDCVLLVIGNTLSSLSKNVHHGAMLYTFT
eukprot:CFRG0300T1